MGARDPKFDPIRAQLATLQDRIASRLRLMSRHGQDPRTNLVRAHLRVVRDRLEALVRLLDGDPEEAARVRKKIEAARAAGQDPFLAAFEDVAGPGTGRALPPPGGPPGLPSSGAPPLVEVLRALEVGSAKVITKESK